MSENSEEEQSPGVLGRIGNWLSPWKGKSPKTQTENSSTTCDRAVESEGESCEEDTHAEAKKRKWEEKGRRTNPDPLGASRDIFRFEEADAIQSAHRDDSVASGKVTPPKEEELLFSKRQRIGQAKEGSHGTWVSGNSERFACHLTDLSANASSSEQGAVRNSDRVNAQPLPQKTTRALAGRKLHVYVEETSVTHCGQDTLTGQEVILTTIKKKLPVLSKSKSPKSPTFDSSRGSSSRADEGTLANLKQAVVPQEGVSQKLHKDWRLELELDAEQTEADKMGRKNSAKKKSRKSSQGDDACSPQGKTSLDVQPGQEGFPSSDSSKTSPQGESTQSHSQVQPFDSSSERSLTSPASPGGGENETSCPQYADKFLGSGSIAAVDCGAVMEDDDRFYKVVRKTETPESKRRSIKVSRTEVKLFPKSVPLNAEKSIAEVELESAPDQEKNKATEVDTREQDKKLEDKPIIGRITDKINIFERQGAVTDLKRTFQTPRSADVSPARKETAKLKAEFLSSTQRSKSAERYDGATSSPAPPQNEIPRTVKERARNFAEESTKHSKSMLPQKTAKKFATSAATTASKSSKPDSQGKLDTKAMTGITLKPGGQDTSAVRAKGSIPREQHGTQSSKTADQGTKSNSIDSSIATKGAGDHVELTNNTSPRSKATVSKPASRSKRRKSREATSPVSEDRESKPNLSQQDATSVKSKVDDEVFRQPDKVDEVLSNKGIFVKKSDKSDPKSASTDAKVVEKLVDRVEALPEPTAVNKDEPDTAPSNRKTKNPIDRVPVRLAQKGAKAEREIPSPKQEIKITAEDKSSSRSQSAEREPASVVRISPAEGPKFDVEPAPRPAPTSRLKPIRHVEKDKEQKNLETKPMSRSQIKDVDQFVSSRCDNSSQAEENLIPPHKTQTQVTTPNSQSRQENSGTEESEAMGNQKNQTGRKEDTRPGGNVKKAKLENHEEAANLPTRTPTANQTVITNPEIAEITVLTQKIKIKSARGPSDDCAPVEKLEASQSEASKKPEGVGAGFVSATPERVPAIVSYDPPAPTNAQTGKTATVQESTDISVQSTDGKPRGSQTQRLAAHSEAVEVKISTTKPSRPQSEEPNNTASTCGLPPFRDKRSDGGLSSTAEALQGKTNQKGIEPPEIIVHPTTVNSDLSSQLQVKDEPGNKPSPTPKVSTSPESKKLNSDSVQQSSPKRMQSQRGLSRDDSSFQRDAPSSWLDVDFPKQRLKLPGPKLSASVSESNLLDNDELDDENFIEKIQKLCAPFSLPPRKHNPLRPPQPPFAMPAIKEDHFEKTFDPDEFKFGLRKKNRTFDTGPSLLAKLQNPETKSGAKPARVSITDRCLLISSLEASSHAKDKTPTKAQEKSKEEKEDHIIVKSRLQGSCVLSSLKSSSTRGRRNGIQALSESTNSRDASPQLSPSSESTSPVPTTTGSFAENFAAPCGDRMQPTAAAVSDSGPPFPSFDDIKLPDYLEKYLPREAANSAQSKEEHPQMKAQAAAKIATTASVTEADLVVKPSLNLPKAVPPAFGNRSGNPLQIYPALSEFKEPVTQRIHTNHARTARGFHKRPGKIVLFQNAEFSGQAYEIYRDVQDATQLQFSSIISVKVIRGCWILYEKPDFQGRCIALEEGGLELTNEWAQPEENTTSPMLIGSIRLAVRDYCTPHIDLFTEPDGHGRVTAYHDDAIETGSFGIPLSTASIQVHSGVWLVFSDPGFQGMLAVLERGVYPVPETWGFPSPFVGSLKPLKMGGFKVENPNEVKALVYEKPGLEGPYWEIDSDLFSFCKGDESDANTHEMKSVGSLKIIGGFWVGYSEEAFEGQQYMLEEGEYLDCSDWGDSGQIRSLRPILADFMSPHLKMFSNQNFSDRGVNIDLIVPVINMDNTGYGTKTQSADVIRGIWVVFEEPGFCGESYILEKGLYGNPEDWGALQDRIASVMPVVLDDFENVAKFKVQLFSEPGFQGSLVTLEDSVATLQQGFSVASCKVLVGSWLAFEDQDFAGRMYLLEEGNYQDVRAMGCVNPTTAIHSLQTVGFEFSQPSIILFERCGLRGKRVVLTDGCVNLQLAEGCARVQSVLVDGGMWILYEGINYRGAQILLKPGEVPDWHQFSEWSKVGSLRPLLQRRVHFRLRNRQTRLLMSVTGDLEDIKLLRIQEAEETDGLDQIWVYRGGHLHCKLLEECCLSPSGSVTIAGSRVGLMPEVDNHVWSITPEGFIRYMPTSDLVLEVKGGHHYDKNQVILNTLDPNKAHQKWDVEII
ncbi:beta/gamma crystallin domain-containing protein 1-like isoform X2 [Hippocampus zosterae]|uniref:beta/gamma crystallin domain-containing protein 1-like isoform X2 n=1 Tax=Hippocampus zosterae TaxID=109293 RepID=UPI00223E7CB7|nr:beta/gamma crystallin domain-containing protein 1-like isoform X2 [Hippocampus zosterae]